MAALGKIRSKGALLIGIIGLGLFAFIAEEAVRSCESSRNNQRQQIGEVLGEKIDVQNYQKLIDEYSDVMKMTQGRDNLTDQEMNQVKDMVWSQYVQNKLIADEAGKRHHDHQGDEQTVASGQFGDQEHAGQRGMHHSGENPAHADGDTVYRIDHCDSGQVQEFGDCIAQKCPGKQGRTEDAAVTAAFHRQG